MSIFQIIDAFTLYGVDVVILSLITELTVQLLKKTLLKNVNKKIYTFLPFIFGAVYYAIYVCLSRLSIAYLFENYVSVLEHGFSVGTLATLIYVCYEQFLREKDNTSTIEGVIATLIEGYVPTDEEEAIAKEIAAAIEKDVTGDGATKTAEILLSHSENATEKDVKLLAKLIIETLAHLNSTAG